MSDQPANRQDLISQFQRRLVALESWPLDQPLTRWDLRLMTGQVLTATITLKEVSPWTP